MSKQTNPEPIIWAERLAAAVRPSRLAADDHRTPTGDGARLEQRLIEGRRAFKGRVG